MPAKQASKKSVRDYLDALVWDGKPRIDRWLIDCAGADDTPHVRAVSRRALVGAVRRVRQPGCKLDEMLVLESPQGMGTSSALRILAVDDRWFTDDLPLESDAAQLVKATAGKWIVEASASKGCSSSALLKACLSRRCDMTRLPYDRKSSLVPRQFVIVGTTSETDYLRDATSNRRFWPVRIQRFDLERLRADRDQLWAEASVAEATGESIFLDPLDPGLCSAEGPA
jgi:predicted P-loop ATPase